MNTNTDKYKWGIYFDRSDPRIFVPKQKRRMSWGFTFNFARPESYLIIAAFIALIFYLSTL
jgi:uncharacterized membrane protein